MSTVADAILASIRNDGYHVNETSHGDRREGIECYALSVEHKTTRETWTVRAADREQAACEPAKALGWGFGKSLRSAAPGLGGDSAGTRGS